jgi:hypothetical protein
MKYLITGPERETTLKLVGSKEEHQKLLAYIQSRLLDINLSFSENHYLKSFGKLIYSYNARVYQILTECKHIDSLIKEIDFLETLQRSSGITNMFRLFMRNFSMSDNILSNAKEVQSLMVEAFCLRKIQEAILVELFNNYGWDNATYSLVVNCDLRGLDYQLMYIFLLRLRTESYRGEIDEVILEAFV